MDIKDLVEAMGFTPRYKGSTGGGEFCSPCPFCGEGDDRFIIQPNNPKYRGGKFSCPRHCRKSGDAITFVMFTEGLTYPQACSRLNIEINTRNHLPFTKKLMKPPVANDPTELWRKKALAFTNWGHEQLIKSEFALSHLFERGFNKNSLVKFKLGFCPNTIWRDRKDWGLEPKNEGSSQKFKLQKGIVIPSFSQQGQVIKINVRNLDFENEIITYEELIAAGKNPRYKPRKYDFVPGQKSVPSIYGNTELPVCLVQESEFDSLLVQQEIGDHLFCIALGGNIKPVDLDTYQLIIRTPTVLFLADDDDAGINGWIKWEMQFPNSILITTPSEKSSGDYFKVGGNLRDWLLEEIEDATNKETNR